MKTKRNLVQACLSALLLLLLPATVQAQFNFTTNDGSITITLYTAGYTETEPEINVVIPDSTNGYPVTSIGDGAFFGCIKLANITIPGSITNIGSGAFNSCFGLTNVAIPASVTSIGDYAFFYCTNLTAIVVDAANPSYSSVDGVLFNKDQTTLRQFPFGKSGSYSIPDGVTSIADEAFGVDDWGGFFNFFPSCIGLTNLVIPGSVTNLETYAFSQCIGLTSVTLSNGISGIGDFAFFRCANLAHIVIPGSVAGIGNNTFDSCSGLTSVTICNGVVDIGGAAFADCWNLTTVAIPDSVTNIGHYAFYACRLTSAAIPNGISRVEDYLFTGCAFTNISIPDNVISVGNDAFEYCANLTSVTIGSNVTRIGELAFSSCTSLTNVIIPDSVTDIDYGAFYYCPHLSTVTIGKNVTSIDYDAFAGCTNLSGVYFRGDAPPDFQDDIFTGDGLYYGEIIEIIYYLPGASGWSSTFADRPTALWLPAMQTSDGNFGVRANQFSFKINWASDRTVVVEACTNLANPDWRPAQTNTLTAGTAWFSDPQWTNYPSRFYRLRSP